MGIVGGATYNLLSRVHEMIPYDKYKEPYKNPKKLKNAEAVFICVPTPMKPSGEMDYSPIHNSLETLVEVNSNNEKRPLVVIRSTAVSGATDMLEKNYDFNFVFNPEFLREKHAIEDMENTDRIVIGANRKEDAEKMESIYRPIFPNANYIFVNRKTAEMIKYAANVTLAGQIAIANEIYQICSRLGIDYDLVKKTVLMDERIGKNIDVPGPDGDFGFGGKCFPKDLNALMYLARENGYHPNLLEEIWRLNEKVRKNKDWLNITGTMSENNLDKKK